MPRPDWPRAMRDRTRIAQAAARLIIEHGLSDWSVAKRKACRLLGLPDHQALPGNEEVEQALRDYNSLFQPTEQAASLRAQRIEALEWMERLSAWLPVLTGAVAAGWATEHSEIRLELEAEDPKAVEMALINAGVDYVAAAPQAEAPPAAQLRISGKNATLRLMILSPKQRWNRQRRNDNERMTVAELRSALAQTGRPSGPRLV